MSFVVYWAGNEYSKHDSHTIRTTFVCGYYIPLSKSIVRPSKRWTEWLQGNRHQLTQLMEKMKYSCWPFSLFAAQDVTFNLVLCFGEIFIYSEYVPVCAMCVQFDNFAAFTLQCIWLFPWYLHIEWQCDRAFSFLPILIQLSKMYEIPCNFKYLIKPCACILCIFVCINFFSACRCDALSTFSSVSWIVYFMRCFGFSMSRKSFAFYDRSKRRNVLKSLSQV